MRYQVIDESASAHSKQEFAVIDTNKPEYDSAYIMCKCFSKQHAIKIAVLLNYLPSLGGLMDRSDV